MTNMALRIADYLDMQEIKASLDDIFKLRLKIFL